MADSVLDTSDTGISHLSLFWLGHPLQSKAISLFILDSYAIVPLNDQYISIKTLG